jgi:glucose 1-dehydrogenase
MQGLSGKNVLITGGTSGIGQAIAVRFAGEGANVAVNYRKTPEDAQDTEDKVQECIAQVDQHGVKHVLVQGDVSREDQVKEMFRETIRRLGQIDILINNAGIQIQKPTEEVTKEEVSKVLDVNLKGAFYCAQAAIRHFIAREIQGVIINISSVHQIIPKPGFIGYSMSKGGMQNLTRTLALEYAARGIRVNGIGPGATITPMNKGWAEDPEKAREILQHIPLGRAGVADEMGAAATFLASDDASYITGQTLYVDGGLTLYPDFRSDWSSD